MQSFFALFAHLRMILQVAIDKFALLHIIAEEDIPFLFSAALLAPHFSVMSTRTLVSLCL